MKIDEALSRYENELQHIRGRRRATVWNYRSVIQEYRSVVGDQPLDKMFTIDNLAIFMKSAENRSDSRKAYYVLVLKMFTKWLRKRRFLPEDPFEDVPPFRYERPAPRALRWSEAEAQIDNATIPGRHDLSKRDHALLTFILYTACRPSEALNVTVQDLDLERGTVTFVNTKGKRPRSVFLPGTLKEELDKYLPNRALRWPKSDWLFPSWRGGKMDRHALTSLKRRYGITVDISQFRPTAATKILKETKNLRLAQVILGHASIATTERYLSVWDEDKIEAAKALDK